MYRAGFHICTSSIEDIFAEWKIYFWNQGLTDNHLTVTLEREHIMELRDYLASVYKK